MVRYSFQRTNPRSTGGPEQFNIVVEEQDERTFFGGPLPAYDGPADFLIYRDIGDINPNLFRVGYHHKTGEILQHLAVTLSSRDPFQRACLAANTASALLRFLEYQKHTAMACTLQKFDLEACDKKFALKPESCLMDLRTLSAMLIVEDDERQYRPSRPDPESQLIACAVAAFQRNIKYRKDASAPFAAQVMYGFTMNCFLPTFYKIPVTLELEHAIRSGQLPPAQTVVHRHTLSLPVERLRNEGITALPNREYIVQCFQAFRDIVWSEEGLTDIVWSEEGLCKGHRDAERNVQVDSFMRCGATNLVMVKGINS